MRVLGLRIPDHEVGIAARGAISPFCGYMPKMRAGVVEISSTKRFERQLALVHAVMMDQLQPVLDARPAVGDLGEIVLAQHLLVFETERAMVGGDHLQVIVLQSVPQLRQVLLRAQRRREHVLRAFEIRAAPVLRSRAAGTAGRSRQTPARRGRAPPAPGSARPRDDRCTMYTGAPAISAMAMARCTASASARGGRVSA